MKIFTPEPVEVSIYFDKVLSKTHNRDLQSILKRILFEEKKVPTFYIDLIVYDKNERMICIDSRYKTHIRFIIFKLIK